MHSPNYFIDSLIWDLGLKKKIQLFSVMVDLNSEILSDLLLEARTTLLTWGKLVRLRLKYQKLQNLQMKLNLHLNRTFALRKRRFYFLMNEAVFLRVLAEMTSALPQSKQNRWPSTKVGNTFSVSLSYLSFPPSLISFSDLSPPCVPLIVHKLFPLFQGNN